MDKDILRDKDLRLISDLLKSVYGTNETVQKYANILNRIADRMEYNDGIVVTDTAVKIQHRI